MKTLRTVINVMNKMEMGAYVDRTTLAGQFRRRNVHPASWQAVVTKLVKLMYVDCRDSYVLLRVKIPSAEAVEREYERLKETAA